MWYAEVVGVVEQVDCPVMHDVVLKGIFQSEILKMCSVRG